MSGAIAPPIQHNYNGVFSHPETQTPSPKSPQETMAVRFLDGSGK